MGYGEAGAVTATWEGSAARGAGTGRRGSRGGEEGGEGGQVGVLICHSHQHAPVPAIIIALVGAKLVVALGLQGVD